MNEESVETLRQNGLDVVDRQLCRRTTKGPAPVANFNAWVAEEVVRCDGLDCDRYVVVHGEMSDGETLPPLRIPAKELASLGWLPQHWGVRPIVRIKAPVQLALQLTAEHSLRRETFTHTGWANGVFLTSDRADVELPYELQRYSLPAKPRDVVEAFRASLALLHVAPLRITFPLWAAQYLAPLCPWLRHDFALWLHGETGTMKSTLAALFLSHYGEFQRTTLPASWTATENALEALAFLAKDVPLVIDDFSSRDLQPKAERIVRGQGNASGRSRMSPDLRLHRVYHPRGVIVSTGEDVPSGRSLLARALVLDLAPRSVKVSALSEAQRQSELYPHALSAYVQWLADRQDTLTPELFAKWEAVRASVSTRKRHLRQPEIAASLYVAAETALTFGSQIGAIAADEVNALLNQGRATLLRSISAQARLVDAESPHALFVQTLNELLATGRCAVISVRKEGRSFRIASPARGSATQVGWSDDDHVYLLGLAYREVEKQAGLLPLKPVTLWKELAQHGIVIRGGRGRILSSVVIEGRQRWVYVIPKNALLGPGA